MAAVSARAGSRASFHATMIVPSLRAAWAAAIVTDSIPYDGNIERRHRTHVTGREAAKTAVPQPGLLLLLYQSWQVLPELRPSLNDGVPDAQIDEAVAEMRSGQELR
jgi:hypothetical protein